MQLGCFLCLTMGSNRTTSNIYYSPHLANGLCSVHKSMFLDDDFAPFSLCANGVRDAALVEDCNFGILNRSKRSRHRLAITRGKIVRFY